ncbi:hypothetical protein JW992_00220 [candidate division KSB1 bacterium]|nr:hypothetical protein [candidate division KSB1 bacterium]
MHETHILVALVGQVAVDRTSVQMEGRIVRTLDSKKIGVLLANERVLLR